MARRKAEYADLKDRIAAREVGAEPFTAEVQSHNEQVTLFCYHGTQPHPFLNSHAEKKASLQSDLAEARACQLVSAKSLVAMTQRFEQFRQSAERFCLCKE